MSADDASPTGNVPAQCYDEKNWEETNALNNKTHHRRHDAVRTRARHFAGGGRLPGPSGHIVVPFAPAGPTDVMARLIAQKLSDSLKQQLYIENHPGAGGNIGMTQVAKSPSDGYTILVASSSYVVNPSLYAKNPYDPFKDFAPVTLAAASPNILVVHSIFRPSRSRSLST